MDRSTAEAPSGTPPGRSSGDTAEDRAGPAGDRRSRRSGRGGEHGLPGKIGSLAKRTVVSTVVLGALVVTVLGLGFLVYRNRIAPGPFLLLVGIVVGFLLGRLDAAL